jgi:hypothetical protein
MPTGDLPTFVDLLVTSHRPALFHQYLEVLPNGTRIAPTQFNPATAARFSGITAAPPRAMFYAGDSRACAMWECPPLRDLVGPKVALSRRQLTNRRVVELELQRDLKLVDLDIMTQRRMMSGKSDIDLLEELKQTTAHGRTHAAAAAILALAHARGVALDGLTWRSKQHGTGAVYLLYSPPANETDFNVVPGSEIALDEPAQGWPVIDAALAEAGMRRMTADDDAGDVLAQP